MDGHTDSRNEDLCNVPWQVATLDRVNVHAIAIAYHNGKSLTFSISYESSREVSAFDLVQCNHVCNESTFSDFYLSFREWFLRVGEEWPP